MARLCPRSARIARFTGLSRETSLGHILLRICSRMSKHDHLSGLLARLAQLDSGLGAGRRELVGRTDVVAWSSRRLKIGAASAITTLTNPFVFTDATSPVNNSTPTAIGTKSSYLTDIPSRGLRFACSPNISLRCIIHLCVINRSQRWNFVLDQPILFHFSNANQRAPGSFHEAQERPAYKGVDCPADWRKSFG